MSGTSPTDPHGSQNPYGADPYGAAPQRPTPGSVSYTHPTLPTSELV